MSEFDYRKPFQTRDGRKARLLCNNMCDGPYVLCVAVTGDSGRESPRNYAKDGAYFVGDTSTLDLVNVPEKRKRLLRADELPSDFWVMPQVATRLVYRVVGVDATGSILICGESWRTIGFYQARGYRWHEDRNAPTGQWHSFEVEETV